MKNLAGIVLLVFMFLTVGCNVYHSSNATVEEAVRSQKRVQVAFTNNVFYEFKRLQRENGQLVGITAPKSDTAKKLQEYPATQDGDILKISLKESEIEEIHLKNGTASNLVNFGVPAVIVGGVVILTAADIDTGGGF